MLMVACRGRGEAREGTCMVGAAESCGVLSEASGYGGSAWSRSAAWRRAVACEMEAGESGLR